jgi:hypothetical protein
VQRESAMRREPGKILEALFRLCSGSLQALVRLYEGSRKALSRRY